MKRKIITSLFLCVCLLVTGAGAFAMENNSEQNMDYSYDDLDVNPLKASDRAILIDNDFSEKDISILGSDAKIVAKLIIDNEFTDEELWNLKNGWVTSRPEAPEENYKRLKSYEVIDGLVQHENGIQFAVPNLVNPNAPTDLTERDSKIDPLRASLEGSGPHVITYSKASYRFNEQTAYVKLPSTTIATELHPNGALIYARPYCMFGAYQTVSPWKGFDTGLVYIKELGGWQLFFKGLGLPWYDTTKVHKLSAGTEVYLHMQMRSDSYVNVIVRNPSDWKIIDQVSYWYNASFNNLPVNIQVTRETTMAQHVRANANSKLLNAKWRAVTLYSASSGLNTLATSTYLQAYNTSERMPWSTALPLYIIAENAYDKTKVKISSATGYYAETVSIDINANPTWQ